MKTTPRTARSVFTAQLVTVADWDRGSYRKIRYPHSRFVESET